MVASHGHVITGHMSTVSATTKQPLTVSAYHSLYLGHYISPDVLMSGQTRTGSARLNVYHGTKRQLIGIAASQVSPAWRTLDGTGGPAATNGSASSLSKKALQRGSKILRSNLPMDVAEAEVEVGVIAVSSLHDTLITCRSYSRERLDQ